MKKTDGGNGNADTLQPQPDGESLETRPPRRWPAVAVTLLLLGAASGGVCSILWFSAAFTDTPVRIAFAVGSVLNLFIFLAIVAQACIYWGQRNLMRQQWLTMHGQGEILKRQLENIEKTERAYLGISQMKLGELEIGCPYRVNIALFNGGKTPAWNVDVASQVIVGRGAFPATLPPLTARQTTEVFIPYNKEKVIWATYDNVIVTQEAVDHLTDGTWNLFVYGEIRYVDFANRSQALSFHAEFDTENWRFIEHQSHKTPTNPN